jgi:hypothetical protein
MSSATALNLCGKPSGSLQMLHAWIIATRRWHCGKLRLLDGELVHAD